jgi:hypothetical protein
MAFDLIAFRQHFPEFSEANIQVYSDASITFWAGIGDLRLNTYRWGDLLTHGLELFVAHHVSLAAAEQQAALVGDVAGQAVNLKNNKSVGDVSVGIDNQAIIKEGAGNYNLTLYGRDFFELARIVGAGGDLV